MKNEKILHLPLIMYKQKMCIGWTKKISGIYAWINENNGKMYIGQTSNFCKRVYGEMNGFKNKQNQDMPKLFNAIQKHGIDKFRVVRLLECPKEYLNKTEQLLIKYYNTYKGGYNCNIGGDGSGGHVVTPEQIEKQKKSLLQYYKYNIHKKSIIKDIISPTNEIIHICGLYEFCIKYNVRYVGISNVLNGKKKHHKGWHIDPNFVFNPTIKKLMSPDGKLYKFGSSVKFCRDHKLELSGIKRILNKKSKHYKLWRLPETPLEDAINNKNFVYKNIRFQFQDNHIEQIIDRKYFCEKFGFSQKYLYKFLKNKSVGSTFHGLKLISK